GQLQILDVLVGQCGQGQGASGNADAFALAEQPTADHGALSPLSGYSSHDQLDAAVVQQDSVTRVKGFDQLAVADLDLVLLLSPGGGQVDPSAPHQALERRVERTGANLRSLQVAQE